MRPTAPRPILKSLDGSNPPLSTIQSFSFRTSRIIERNLPVCAQFGINVWTRSVLDRQGVARRITPLELLAGDPVQWKTVSKQIEALPREWGGHLLVDCDDPLAVHKFCSTLPISSLVLTLFVAVWNHRAQQQEEMIQVHQKSADLMIKFGEMLDSGRSGLIVLELDRRGNLDHIKLSGDALEDALDEFLSNYESIDAAQKYRLIDADMADDAFEFDLAKALKDRTILTYIAASRRDESDLWDGVLGLARTWNIRFTLPPSASASHEVPQRPLP